MSITKTMKRVLLAAAEVPRFEGADINARTLRSLCALDLIKPTKFQPCFPVPIPTHWRLTEKGQRIVNESVKKND